MNARLLDVLHDAADVASALGRIAPGVAVVADRVHVELERVEEELVNENGMLLVDVPLAIRRGQRALDVLHQVVDVVAHLHAATAQNIGGAHQHGIPDPLGHLDRLLLRETDAALRLPQTELAQHGLESFAVLRQMDVLR